MDDIDDKLFAQGPCTACETIFTFSPYTVPSVFIDPVTRKSPDLLPVAEQPAAMERARKEPVCPDCVDRANKIRKQNNLPLIS